MSEAEQQRETSPLLSERGVTTISDTVVSQLAGMAAREVEGVHMGGGVSRTASGVFGSITGSESKTSGISVEVGRTETAIDLKMGVEYNRNILQTVDEVRRRITDRVENITGLRIKELNATITDITFPEKEQLLIGSGTSTREDSTESAAADTTATESEPEVQTTQESEPAPDVSETTRVETTQVETTDSTADEPEEASTVEEGPREESETTEVRTEEQPADEIPEASEEAQETTQEVRAETPEEPEARPESETPEEPETGPETPEPDTPEARMRRRAEERARRRRRRSQDS